MCMSFLLALQFNPDVPIHKAAKLETCLHNSCPSRDIATIG